MSLPLNFYFTTKDPNFTTNSTVVSNAPGNYISHVFVKAPLYSFNNNPNPIGYKVTDDYIQQVGENKYIIRLNNSYYLEGRGSISWQYVFENNVPQVYYPINQLVASNIISTTGEFFGKSGTVSLFPKEDGSRLVNVTFNQ